jgi:hypothetical protein
VILPLRRVHRSAFLALALFLPALLVSAWKVRRGAAVQELPPELLSAQPGLPLAADELVYWSRTPPARPGELPADAELVGTVRGGALGITPPPGTRVLRYSLPHGVAEPVEDGR